MLIQLNRARFSCTCLSGFTDTSANYGLDPGRICSVTSNECADSRLNTCDENADCLDTNDGYSCLCYDGFIDVSPLQKVFNTDVRYRRLLVFRQAVFAQLPRLAPSKRQI